MHISSFMKIHQVVFYLSLPQENVEFLSLDSLISLSQTGFKNEDEIHFFLACLLYYRPRVTLLNALAHIAPLTVRTLLYRNYIFEFEENKIIITETLRFIKESKRFD